MDWSILDNTTQKAIHALLVEDRRMMVRCDGVIGLGDSLDPPDYDKIMDGLTDAINELEVLFRSTSRLPPS